MVFKRNLTKNSLLPYLTNTLRVTTAFTATTLTGLYALGETPETVNQTASKIADYKYIPPKFVDMTGTGYYRTDGVRITHDPYAKGMMEKYGAPGQTDNEGFDPYADTVGAGIYGGRVERDDLGRVKIGKQYQNHNPRPGPIYMGGGYAPIAEALKDKDQLRNLLTKYPDLVNDVTTGGAQPLHMCGMGRSNQDKVKILVEFGADVEALDTYGMTPLHRMASNNLAVGAKMLLESGADSGYTGLIGETARNVAMGSRAMDVIKVLDDWERSKGTTSAGGNKGVPNNNITSVVVEGGDLVSKVDTGVKGSTDTDSEISLINGVYEPVDASTSIPTGFDKVCKQQGWDTKEMWKKLSGHGHNGTTTSKKVFWFKHKENESYIYKNKMDSKWWIDGPSGEGVFIADGGDKSVPAHGWKSVKGEEAGGKRVVMPMVRTFRSL